MYTVEIFPCYLSLLMVEKQLKEKFSPRNLEHAYGNWRKKSHTFMSVHKDSQCECHLLLVTFQNSIHILTKHKL